MALDHSLRAAAHVANDAVDGVLEDYRNEQLTDEDDITGALQGGLGRAFRDQQIEGLKWSSTVVRHRKGKAAQERQIGADLIIHVSLRTADVHYSKGVLVQAKRVEPEERMSTASLNELVSQCNRMIGVTPAAFVFDYTKNSMRTAPASKIVGRTNTNLYSGCVWTSYRFFLELFRCPIGDPRITSAKFRDLPIPFKVALSATGDVADEY